MKNAKGLVAALVCILIGSLIGLIFAYTLPSPKLARQKAQIDSDRTILANIQKEIASKQIALANYAKISIPDSLPDQNNYEYLGTFSLTVDVVDPKDIYSQGNAVVLEYCVPITADYYKSTRDTMLVNSWQTVYNPSGTNIEAINISKLILLKRTKRKL